MVRTIESNPDLLVDFGIDATSVVIDAGAYVGEWSERISRGSGARVYAFEPSPVPRERLYQRVAAYPNVSVFEYGLGARDETATLTLQGPGSSVHDDVNANTSQFDRAAVAIRDVAAVLRELRLEHVDLLKLNIEGSEYDVLERLAETGWLPRIGIVLVQFHEWLPKVHRRRKATQRVLRRTHTQLWDYPWVWEAWRREATG
jgi:FkbM family methyltransferase